MENYCILNMDYGSTKKYNVWEKLCNKRYNLI